MKEMKTWGEENDAFIAAQCAKLMAGEKTDEFYDVARSFGNDMSATAYGQLKYIAGEALKSFDDPNHAACLCALVIRASFSCGGTEEERQQWIADFVARVEQATDFATHLVDSEDYQAYRPQYGLGALTRWISECRGRAWHDDFSYEKSKEYEVLVTTARVVLAERALAAGYYNVRSIVGNAHDGDTGFQVIAFYKRNLAHFPDYASFCRPTFNLVHYQAIYREKLEFQKSLMELEALHHFEVAPTDRNPDILVEAAELAGRDDGARWIFKFHFGKATLERQLTFLEGNHGTNPIRGIHIDWAIDHMRDKVMFDRSADPVLVLTACEYLLPCYRGDKSAMLGLLDTMQHAVTAMPSTPTKAGKAGASGVEVPALK